MFHVHKRRSDAAGGISHAAPPLLPAIAAAVCAVFGLAGAALHFMDFPAASTISIALCLVA